VNEFRHAETSSAFRPRSATFSFIFYFAGDFFLNLVWVAGEVGFLLKEKLAKFKYKMHCLGQVIYFYISGYVKFIEYTLGIRLGHFR